MKRYLGFGVVAQRTKEAVLVENSINGQSWAIPVGNVPEHSACRTAGHVVNVFAEGEQLFIEWAR